MAVADVSKGTQDIEYGWNGDSTTPNSNFVRVSDFDGTKMSECRCNSKRNV